MPPNRFDQASRYAAKLDASGFLCWLLREDAAELRFRTWLDTRTLPFPGEPERTCDTVAWLADADPAVEWAVPVEFFWSRMAKCSAGCWFTWGNYGGRNGPRKREKNDFRWARSLSI